MSVEEVSPLKPSQARPSLSVLPRVSLFLSERVSSNDDNTSTEISTPLLPKNPWGKSKLGLSAKKSRFSDRQADQENDQPDKIILLDVGTLPLDTLKPFEVSSPLGSSSCGDESPFQRSSRRMSPKKQREVKFDEAFYKRIEDFLELEHLNIVQPEDNRRSMFAHLRVSTARIQSLRNGNNISGTMSEANSPALISPSIQTSTLFTRRSSSKEVSADRAPKLKRVLTKSPFSTFGAKGDDESESTTPAYRKMINLDTDDSPCRKPSSRINASGSKLQGLSICTNKNRSNIVEIINLDDEDLNSPTKI